jgi:hypothetical protein
VWSSEHGIAQLPVLVQQRSCVRKPGCGIEGAELLTAVPLHTLAMVGLSADESTCCDGSETVCRTLDNERLVEREHRQETGRQHARSYPVPNLELVTPFANGSGEVPLQVELKTI